MCIMYFSEVFYIRAIGTLIFLYIYYITNIVCIRNIKLVTTCIRENKNRIITNYIRSTHNA